MTMENQGETSPVGPENPVPFKSTYYEIPELGVEGWVHEMNEPGPQVYEALKNWIARSTLQELFSNDNSQIDHTSNSTKKAS